MAIHSVQKSSKLTIEGEPETVEAIAQQIKELFEITYQSKNQRIALRPGIIRRQLYVIPLTRSGN